MSQSTEPEPLLTRRQVAALCGVGARTVTRWARSGRLASVRPGGGHRRFRPSDVRALIGGAR